ncbi:hypothetical protein AGR1A_Cc50588 [Agrobacterium fabacearum CFBP 5771]|nr:hypothetical protein AGR1B_Cc10014 [Agrobacterium fabacearum S56]CUW95008.1 hypothetical protein AGR1C_Cc50587 [Agrobacterium fabacearum TT111]CVI18883.1 hypothetical protein AGR1A_Cc50588 [Agrobacterium fabacearum CFBP 5771]
MSSQANFAQALHFYDHMTRSSFPKKMFPDPLNSLGESRGVRASIRPQSNDSEDKCKSYWSMTASRFLLP